jgi:hypothetical protein
MMQRVRTPTARGTALILLGVILGFLAIVDLATDDSRRALVDILLAVVAIGAGAVLVYRDRDA